MGFVHFSAETGRWDVPVFVHTVSFHFPGGVCGWDVHTGVGAEGFRGLLDLPGQVLQDAGGVARCPTCPGAAQGWVRLLGFPVRQGG